MSRMSAPVFTTAVLPDGETLRRSLHATPDADVDRALFPIPQGESMMHQPRPISLLAVLAAATLVLGAALPARAASFLWRVEDQGRKVYLAGSMHFATKDMYPLDPAFEKAFQESRGLVVEVDVASEPQKMARLLLELAVWPEGKSLRSELSDAAKDAFERAGLDWTRYDRFRPWYALLSMQAQALVKAGFRPEMGIDMHFLGRAHEQDMPVYELESLEEQFRLLAGLEEMGQDEYLRFSLLQQRTMEKQAHRMAKLWTQGDTGKMEQLLFGSPLFNAVFRPINEKLFFDRNQRMAAQVLEYLHRDEPVLIIVGAGHLLGPQGMLELLREHGCSLTQM
jgi:hypothetical protein